MRYKDWIKAGQMTAEEILNDIELLAGVLKGEYSENAITKLEKELDEANMRNINLRGENKQLKAANFKYTLRISQIESVCVDAWEEQE
jgi:hypothetical protein